MKKYLAKAALSRNIVGSHAWAHTRNQKRPGRQLPDGVEFSLQPYDSEEMPGPIERCYFRCNMHHVHILHSEFQPLLYSRCNRLLRLTPNFFKNAFMSSPFSYLIICQKASLPYVSCELTNSINIKYVIEHEKNSVMV